MFDQGFKDTITFLMAESVTLSQHRWPLRAMQDKNSFTVRTDDVNMRGAMIVRIDDNAQASEAKNGRHVSV